MPSLSALIAAQLGLGSLPLASSKAAVPGLVDVGAEKAQQEARVRDQRQRLFNSKPELLTTQGRRAMRLEKGKEVPQPSSPSPPQPSELPQSSKKEAMAQAPLWEAGMDIVRKVRASGDLALVSKLNTQLQAVESGNPDIAIPAAAELQKWYKNSPMSITQGTVAKPVKRKEKN